MMAIGGGSVFSLAWDFLMPQTLLNPSVQTQTHTICSVLLSLSLSLTHPHAHVRAHADDGDRWRTRVFVGMGRPTTIPPGRRASDHQRVSARSRRGAENEPAAAEVRERAREREGGRPRRGTENEPAAAEMCERERERGRDDGRSLAVARRLFGGCWWGGCWRGGCWL
jgi:hypothetical protein